jgi:hypothetical protein
MFRPQTAIIRCLSYVTHVTVHYNMHWSLLIFLRLRQSPNGFKRRTFPLLWVPETGRVRVTSRLEVYLQSVRLGTKSFVVHDQTLISTDLLTTSRHGRQRKHRFPLFLCPIVALETCLFAKPLLGNGCLSWLYSSCLEQICSNILHDICFRSLSVPKKFILTKLVHPCRWVVAAEMLTVAQLDKNLLTLNGTWRFITGFIGVHHWSVSWARWIHSIPSNPISSKLILGYFLIYV